jgi:hypothetical protein
MKEPTPPIIPPKSAEDLLKLKQELDKRKRDPEYMQFLEEHVR